MAIEQTGPEACGGDGLQPKNPAPDLKLGCSPEEGLRLGPGINPWLCTSVSGCDR